MSTESFDKTFVVTDPKAIEQFLYDLEHAEPQKYAIKQPTQAEIEQKEKILAFLRQQAGQTS